MADEDNDEQQQSGVASLPRVTRDIGASPIVPSAPSDAEDIQQLPDAGETITPPRPPSQTVRQQQPTQIRPEDTEQRGQTGGKHEDQRRYWRDPQTGDVLKVGVSGGVQGTRSEVLAKSRAAKQANLPDDKWQQYNEAMNRYDLRVAGANARDENRAANAETNEALRQSHVLSERDEEGNLVPFRDAEGNIQYRTGKGPVEYDETGHAVQTEYTPQGPKQTQPDANAPIGTHPDQPNMLFRQNSKSPWDYIGTVQEGLESKDENVKSAAQGAQLKLDKRLHGDVANTLGQNLASVTQDIRGKAATLKNLQSQLGQITDQQLNEKTGGIFGVGASPTAEAQAAQAKKADIEKQIEDIQSKGYSTGKILPGTDVSARLKDAQSALKDWRSVAPKELGDLDSAVQARQATLAENGVDPESDPVLSALQERKKQLWITGTHGTNGTDESDLRQDPAFGPLMQERDALDEQHKAVADHLNTISDQYEQKLAPARADIQSAQNQIAPLEQVGGRLMGRLEQLVGMDPAQPGEDLDVRRDEVSNRLAQLTDTGDKARAQTLLNRIEPILSEITQRKAALQPLIDAHDAVANERNGLIQSEFEANEAQLAPQRQALQQKFEAEGDRRYQAWSDQFTKGLMQSQNGSYYVASPDGTVRFLPGHELTGLNQAVRDGALPQESVPQLNAAMDNISKSVFKDAQSRALAEQKIGEDWQSGNVPKGLYKQNEDGGITFDRGYTAPAMAAAMRDGVLSPDWVREHLDDARKADDEYAALMKSAGSNSKLKAFIDSGIKSYLAFQGGAAASAGVAPFDPELATAGAGITAPVGGWGAVALPALVHGIAFLGGAALTGAATKAILSRAEKYSDLVSSLESSAQLQPGYAAAGELAGMGPAAMASFRGFSQAAAAISEKQGTAAAVKFVATKLASGAGAGAAFEATLRPAFDAATHALGINPDDVHYPTFASIAQAAAIMGVLSGENLNETFKRAAGMAANAKPEAADLTKEAIAKAKKDGVTPEFRAFFGGIDPEVAGTTHEKVAAFAKSLGMEYKPVPKPIEEVPQGTQTSAKAPGGTEPSMAPASGGATEQGVVSQRRPTIQEAHQEIDNLQMEGKSPEEHAVTQDALRGMVKIAQGQPMDALTAVEKKAVLTKDENGIARVEMVKGQPIITDAALDRVRQIAPVTSQILPQSEEEQRGHALKPESQPTFAVEVQGRGGETEVKQVQAPTEEAAKSKVANSKVAESIEPGQGMVRDVTRVPSDLQLNASLGNNVDEVKQNLGDATVQRLSVWGGRALRPEEEKTFRKAIAPFAEPVHRWQQIFNSVEITPDKIGSAGAGVGVENLNLRLSIPDIIQHVVELGKDQGPEITVRQEAIHAAALHLIRQGVIDPVGIYQQMPDEAKSWLHGVYEPDSKERSDFVDGHEFFRMMVEDKLSLDGDKLLDEDGRVITENLSHSFIQRIRDALVKLIKFFRDIAGHLRSMGATDDLIKETIRTRDAIISKLKEVDAWKQNAVLAKGETGEKGGVSAKRPPVKPTEGGRVVNPKPSREAGAGGRAGSVGGSAGVEVRNRATPEDVARTLKSNFGEQLAVGHQSKVTQGGRTFDVAYVAQPAAEARPSHNELGQVTPGYPQQLQPRDRSLPQYRRQSQNIAQNLDFAKSSFFPETNVPATTPDIGAPIMTGSGHTLVGNGREIGILSAYKANTPSARKYKRDFVKNATAFGLNPDEVRAMVNPVLKRVILGNPSTEDLVRFSQESNEGVSMGQNATEVANRDASRLTPELLSEFDPNYALDSGKNRQFLQSYLRDIVRGSEANEANINWPDLARRVRAAVFTYAYGADEAGRAALDRLQGEDASRKITSGLLTVAPIVARMRADIEGGRLHPLDISSDISRAVQDISEALRNKPKGQNAAVALNALRDQADLISDAGKLSIQGAIRDFLIDKRNHRAAIEEALSNYVESVYQIGNPQQGTLFGEQPAEDHDKVQLWHLATRPEAIAPKTEERALAAQALELGILRSQPLNDKGERVDKVAVRFPSGEVRTGVSHAGLIAAEYQEERKVPYDKIEQGFTTTTGRFLNREEAFKLFAGHNENNRWRLTAEHLNPPQRTALRSQPTGRRLRPGDVVDTFFGRGVVRTSGDTMVGVKVGGKIRLLKPESVIRRPFTSLEVSPNLPTSHPAIDERLQKAFPGAKFNSLGLPDIPETLPTGHGLLKPTNELKTAYLDEGSLAVKLALLPVGSHPRDVLHNAILRHFLNGGTIAGKGVKPERQEHPEILFMGGGSGAGKTSSLRKFKPTQDPHVLVNADEVREFIPEYDRIVAKGDGRAAYVTHVEASSLADRILELAMQAKFNIVNDGTMKTEKNAVAVLEKAEKAGYTPEFLGVTIDPYEAAVRAALRAQKSGRWVHYGMLFGAHQSFNANLAKYLNRFAGRTAVFDNTGSEPVEIPVENVRQKRYREVDERSQINPEGKTRQEIYAGTGEGVTEQPEAGGMESALQGVGRDGSQSLALKSQELDLFSDYAATLPASAKVSKPALQREVSKDVPELASNQDALNALADLAQSTLTPKAESGIAKTNEVAANKPVRANRKSKVGTETATGVDDLFSLLAGQHQSERDSELAGGTGKGATGAPGQSDVAGAGDLHGNRPDTGRPGGSVTAGDTDGGRGVTETSDTGGNAAPGATGGKRSLPKLVTRPSDPNARNYVIPRDTKEISPRGAMAKLRANQEAIRLLKQIETEQRLATPDEKSQLVKFSGWGALSQAFDDAKAERLEASEGGVSTLDGLKSELERYRGYQADNPTSSYYSASIAELEKDIRSLESWRDKWGEIHKELKSVLTPEEYKRAKRSTINAHYTSPEVIRSMWDIAAHLGFKGGNVLEPGAGVGHFFGLMPEELSNRSSLHAVELDDISGRLTRMLYPEADVQITGFQNADIADGSVDLAISNVPFANVPVTDKAMQLAGGPTDNLHDYFLANMIKKLRPGGLNIAITSAFTMDKQAGENRKWMADRADLVAAFRLPNNAFKANAGTDVVTDILVLRKKDGQIFPHAKDWTALDNALTQKGDQIRVNQYFAQHPTDILGFLADDGEMFAHGAGEKEMTVHPDPNRPPDVAIQQAIDNLPKDIAGDGAAAEVRSNDPTISKMGSIVQKDGKYFFHGQENPDEALNDPKNAKRVRRFIEARDVLNEQYRLELDPEATEEDVEANRRMLNARYDTFTKDFGNFHTPKNKNLFIDDPDWFRLAGAEIPVQVSGGMKEMLSILDGKKTRQFTKADVFKKRVLTPIVEPTKADSLEDAFGMSLGWRGRVDLGYIADLTGQSREQVEQGLVASGIVVRDPVNGQLQSREQYLAGNVRKKLEIARAAGPEYARNAEMLETVQPQDVPIDAIRFKIGATWVPVEAYQQFLQSLGVELPIEYHKSDLSGGRDFYTVGVRDYRARGVAYKDFETDRISVPELMDAMLNMKRIEIMHTDKERKGDVDEGATMAARDAAKRLSDAFAGEWRSGDLVTPGWAQTNAEWAPRLAQTYNREANGFAQRTYDGQFLTLPWASKDFDIYPDKKNVIWRAIQDGRALVAWGVGGGKTVIATGIALEMRRLGLARKPMMVVHNSTLEQYADEISKIAPSARVLIGRKDELGGAKRKEFLMRIAAGDWDAVVIAHSTFGLIEDDPVFQQKHMESLVDEAMSNLGERGFDSVDSAKKSREPSVKQLVKMIEKLETKIHALSERKTDTGLLNFQQLGVDALIVDEVHAFKKMPFSTKLDVKGIDSGMSDRGYAMLLRARSIQERNGGKNVFSMTGTPVTNTLGEIWNQVRLVAPDLLKEYGVETFDQFVSKFAEVETISEAKPSGERQMVERLSKIVNLPEWSTFFRQAADVKLGDDMVVKNRPGIKGGGGQLIALERTPGAAAWVNYIRQVLEGFKDLTYDDFKDNKGLTAVPVQAYVASRAAAIDIRLVEPRAKDEPGSKANRAVREIIKRYRQTSDYKATQVIFSDSFNQVKTSLFDYVVPRSNLKVELDPTKEPGTTFNLYEDIKAKLIALGVPAEEIAIVADKEFDNAKRKKALFEKVNEGKVRIVMGSTEKLGTGVNMQGRMLAAWNLDVPWTAAGLEQRDGRVYRQGNIHAEMGIPVELERLGMKDTLDESLWKIIERKLRIQKQALSGKIVGRELEEMSDVLNLAEQAAILSGPYGAESFELDQRIRELQASRSGHDRQVANRDAEIRSAKLWLSQQEGEEARSEPAMQLMTKLGDRVSKDGAQITVDGDSFETKTAMIERVNALLDAEKNKPTKEKSKAIFSVAVNGVPIRLDVTPTEIEQYEGEGEDQKLVTKPSAQFDLMATDSESPKFGRVTSAVTLLARLEELTGTVQGIRDSRKNNAARLRQLAEMKQLGKWPFEEEYQAALARQQELLRLMRGEEEKKKDDAAVDLVQSKIDRAIEERQQAAQQMAEALKSQPINDRFNEGLPLAMKIAQGFSIRGLDAEDVEQHARIALARAAAEYVPEKATHGFRPFAAASVRNELRSLIESAQRQKRIQQTSSLNTPVGDETATGQDLIPSTSDVRSEAALAEGQRVLNEAVSALPDRMQRAINGILSGVTQREIADEFGISPAAVSKLVIAAMKRLRGKLGEQGITRTSDLLSQAIHDDGRQPQEYSKSSTQVTLSARDAKPFIDFGKSVPEKELYRDPEDPTFGRENEPHITALYGITQESPKLSARVVLGNTTGSITATVGKLSTFKMPKYDVLKADITSPDLERVNAALQKHVPFESDFPDYHPHLTIAYLKHGEGKKYVGDTRFEGKQLRFSDLDFRAKDGRKYTIDLSTPKHPTLSDRLDVIEAGLQDQLKSQASADPLQQLMDSLDADALDKLFEKASAEERGQYTVGRPDLAMGAGEASQRAVDQYYTDLAKPRTRETMQKEADQIIKDAGHTGFAREIADRWLRGDTLRDSEVFAAKQVLSDLSHDTSPEGLRRMFSTGFAYRNIRGQTARDLAAGFDPHKSPEERNREFIVKEVISKLRPDIEAAIEREPDVTKKRDMLDAAMKDRLEQLEKAFAYISKNGVTLEDILSGGIELHGKGKEFLEFQRQNWDVPHQKALKLAQGGERTPSEIAKSTGLTEKDVRDTIDQFNDQVEKELVAKVKAGLRVENMSFEGMLASQPLDVIPSKDLVRLTYKALTDKGNEVKRTVWARKLGPGSYREVNETGEWGGDNKDRRILASPSDIIKEEPAGTNKKYGTLEVLKSQELRAQEISDVDALAEARKIMRGMGLVAAKDQGSFKVTKRKRPKIFVPPKVSRTETPEEIARRENAPVPYPEGQQPPYTGRVLGQPGLPLYQEYMHKKGADLGNFDDVAKIARVAQAINGNRSDMIYEAGLQNLLSGPTTHITYKAGLLANSAFEFTVMRGLESLVNLVYQNPGAPTFKEFKYIFRGVVPSLVRAMTVGARQWSTESDIFDQEFLNSQAELYPGELNAEQSFHRPSISERPLQQFFGEKVKPIEDALQKNLGNWNPVRGRVIRMPARVLWFVDGFIKTLNGIMEVTPQAYRMAQREGLSGEALTKRINELVATPGSPAWIKAGDFAKWMALREPVLTAEQGGNWLDNAVAQFARTRSKSHAWGYFFPFVQLPYNYLKNAARGAAAPVTTPYKFARAAKSSYDAGEGFFNWNGEKFQSNYSKPEQIRDIAKSIAALTVAGIIWRILAGDSDDDDKWVLITGSTPYTQVKKGVRELQQRAYGGPYVIRFGGRNGVHFNYGKYEPAATILGTVADTLINLKHSIKGELGPREAVDALAGYLLAQTDEKSFLMNLDGLSKMFSGETPLTQAVPHMFLNWMVPNLIRQPLRNFDDFVPDAKHSNLAYNLLPMPILRQPKIDVYGNPVQKTGNWFSRMFTMSAIRPYTELKKADRLLIHWNNTHPRDQRAITEPGTTYQDIHGKSQQMSPTESTRFQMAVGKRFDQMLTGQFTSSQVDKPTEAEVKTIENLHRQATEDVKKEMQPRFDKFFKTGSSKSQGPSPNRFNKLAARSMAA